VKTAYIAAVHPVDVAREVEREVEQGCRSFVLRPIAGGAMLDQERLGAARYAAGVHSEVVLDSGAVAVAR
jgi:L-alanine-DL-glutamate epimerase-like enolase superfamily enzyme